MIKGRFRYLFSPVLSYGLYIESEASITKPLLTRSESFVRAMNSKDLACLKRRLLCWDQLPFYKFPREQIFTGYYRYNVYRYVQQHLYHHFEDQDTRFEINARVYDSVTKANHIRNLMKWKIRNTTKAKPHKKCYRIQFILPVFIILFFSSFREIIREENSK